jgi:hypothetical protein
VSDLQFKGSRWSEDDYRNRWWQQRNTPEALHKAVERFENICRHSERHCWQLLKLLRAPGPQYDPARAAATEVRLCFEQHQADSCAAGAKTYCAGGEVPVDLKLAAEARRLEREEAGRPGGE